MGKGRLPRETDFKKQDARRKAKKSKNNDPEAPKQVPRTIENSRKTDATNIPQTSETALDLTFKDDEFSNYFQHGIPPKILITTLRRASKECYQFAKELEGVFYNASVFTRKSSVLLKDLVKEAKAAAFTDIIVIGQRLKEPFSLTMIHLPEGPVALFRLRSIRTAKSLRNHGNPTQHPPELIMNHFTSMLGATVGRFLMSLFPPQPQFTGRQVVTFHHQRDFIFFRRHRYMFEEVVQPSQADDVVPENGKKESLNSAGKEKITVKEKVRLQELGPRFTLKLMSLKKDASPDSSYIWQRKKGSSGRKDAHI